MSISQVFHMVELRGEIFSRKRFIISIIRNLRDDIEDRHRGYEFTFMNFGDTAPVCEKIIHDISLKHAKDWKEAAIILGLEYMIR